MHNPESILRNETHKILCDLEINADHLISARRPHQDSPQKRKKKNLLSSGLCHPDVPESENQRKQKER